MDATHIEQLKKIIVDIYWYYYWY